MISNNRIGTIRIAKKFLTDEHSEILHIIFKKFIPVYCHDEGSVLVYKGYSFEFRICGEGEVFQYDVRVSRSIDLTNDNKYHISFNKID